MPLKSADQAFHEFKAGTLNSGKGGPVVTDRKQAIAIAMSVARKRAEGVKLSTPGHSKTLAEGLYPGKK